MRVGIAQINTVPGTFDQTVERMLVQVQRAAEQGADLVVFPLAALAGVELPSYADRPSYMADAADALAMLAKSLPCPAIVPIPVETESHEPAFEALLVDKDEVQPLCMLARMREERSGEEDLLELPDFEVGGLHFVVALSYEDLDLLASNDFGYDVIIYLSNCPFAMDDPSSAMAADLEASRYWQDACESGSWLVGVAPVGGYGEAVFSGSSFVITPGGKLVVSLPAFEEAVQVVEVGGGPETVEDHGLLSREVFDAPFFLWQAIALGIHDFVIKQGATDVALVLDGSLSSQVLLALATDALGPLHVHVLVGATAGSNAPSCRDLARRLRVDQVDGPGALAGFDPHDLDQLSLAAMARENDAVVLASLDKTGLALGAYAGKVSAAELLPLGDVYRTDVLDMAHVRNTISPIFRRVALGDADALTVVAKDGSRVVVSGEAELTRVDEVLLGFVEYDRPLYELLDDSKADDTLTDAVLRTLRTREVSRRSLAPVLAMSTHTLDEARFPLGVSWQDERRSGLTGADAELLKVAGVADGNDGEDEGDQRGPVVPAAPKPGMSDLGKTLQMLRDLAEQGGFSPTGIAGLSGGLADAREQDAGEDGGSSGWGRSIFSEN